MNPSSFRYFATLILLSFATARAADVPPVDMLGEIPHPEIQKLPAKKKPYWDIERARIGESREVPVEVVVNGFPVARKRSSPTVRYAT